MACVKTYRDLHSNGWGPPSGLASGLMFVCVNFSPVMWDQGFRKTLSNRT